MQIQLTFTRKERKKKRAFKSLAPTAVPASRKYQKNAQMASEIVWGYFSEKPPHYAEVW